MYEEPPPDAQLSRIEPGAYVCPVVPDEFRSAMAIYTALGWTGASFADAERLPIGTPEQQAVACAGLAADDWGEWAVLPIAGIGWSATWVWVDWTVGRSGVLALFAIRVGVSARRAAQALRHASRVDAEVTARVIGDRGAEYAAQFVRVMRPLRMVDDALAEVVLRLLDRYELPLPQNPGYLHGWVAFASSVTTYSAEEAQQLRVRWCDPELIRRRLHENLTGCLRARLDAPWGFADTVTGAVVRGWLEREVAVDLALTALITARRPVDRKEWVRALTGVLDVTDAELTERVDDLVEVLRHGEPLPVESIAPRLIRALGAAALDDAQAARVLAAALPVRTKKARELVLAAARDRGVPRNTWPTA